MPNIFELSCNQSNYNSLQKIKDTLLKEENDKKELQRKQFIENYRKKHIFSSYESALDYAIQHPDKKIEWHTKTLYWEEDKNKFKSYEQEYDISGVMCYDVIRYYTKEELLKGIEEHKENIKKKYPEEDNWWLDEYGKLSYVSL